MTDKNTLKIPTICADSSSVIGLTLFNPNNWEGESRGVVQSCANERSIISYAIDKLTIVCKNADQYCSHHLFTLQQLWKKSQWDLSKGIYFAQVPEIHLMIEAYFASVKSLLDLIVQLLSTEGIVGVEIDGFHRSKNVYGGKVLNSLAKNAKARKKNIAKEFITLIDEHKNIWIDEIINLRDVLIHPNKDANQIMFEMNLTEENGNLICNRIVPPSIGKIPIYKYAKEQLINLDRFVNEFQLIFKNPSAT